VEVVYYVSVIRQNIASVLFLGIDLQVIVVPVEVGSRDFYPVVHLSEGDFAPEPVSIMANQARYLFHSWIPF